MGRRQHTKKPMPIAEAQIEKFSHDGRGIARIEGKTTFIEGALPDEILTFQYTKRKTDFDEGKALDIHQISSLRAEPKCLHYAHCGGCSLQHLKEEAQIEVKQGLLLDLLQRVGHSAPDEILPPLSANSWNYRSKARLSVRYVQKKGKTLIGFREKYNPRYIAEITHCPILTAEVEAELESLAKLIDSFDKPEIIAQIEVAAGEDAIALIFRNLEALTLDDEVKLKAFGQRTGFSIFLQPKGVDSVALFHSKSNEPFLHYTFPDENLKFTFHPTDFTQVNMPLNRKMVNLAMELLDLNEEDVVLDLFCGLGNFSLPIAKRAKKVIGIEGSEMMVTRASKNASDNNCHNTEFYALNLDEPMALVDIISQKLGGIEAFQNRAKILIDPPRTGAFEIVKQMNVIQPVRIVYVSCNPATLARDSDILVNHYGYRLQSAGVMDMFPHTAHVESIAVFERQG